jgi:hypothetical protein
MRPVHIAFIEDRRWRWVWIFVALCCTGMLGGTVWQWKQKDQAIREVIERIGTLQTQLQILRTPVVVKTDPRQGSTQLATQLLQQDLNLVFATPENLQITGVRLRSLSLETASGTLRLEYEMDSITKAAALTESLNMGYEQRPWRLDGVSGAVSGGNAIGRSIAPVMFRGTWSVQLKRL